MSSLPRFLLLLPPLFLMFKPTFAADSSAASFPSDDGSLAGDHIYVRVNVPGFTSIDDSQEQAAKWCAPQGSRMRVTGDAGDVLLIKFVAVSSAPTVPAANPQASTAAPGGGSAHAEGSRARTGLFRSLSYVEPGAVEACGDALVNTFTQYTIRQSDLEKYAYARTGMVFGGLVVPFKFYLKNNKLLASTTIAPYIGVRLPFHVFGATFTPVASAGLGLVPVSNPDDAEADTKPSLSTAVGLVVRNSKNDTFNAGLLIGKDFLNREDRDGDATVNKPWISIYVGATMK